VAEELSLAVVVTALGVNVKGVERVVRGMMLAGMLSEPLEVGV